MASPASTSEPARPAPFPNARYTPLRADGPLPFDMLRATPGIRRDPLAFLGSVTARYGDLVAFPLPTRPVLLVNEPGGADRVLRENHRNYDKHTVQYGSLSLVTGDGLLTSDGEPWRRHRRLAQPAFRPQGLPAVAGHAIAAAEALRAGVVPGRVTDLHAAVLRAALDVVGGSLFGADLGRPGGSSERVVAAVDAALRVVVQRARNPLSAGPLGRLPGPSRRRLRRAVATLDAACLGAVAERRRAADPGADMLGVLLGSGLSDTEIRDELVTFVIAGQDTVSAALTWTLHGVSRSADVQSRLHAELDAVLGGRAPRWDDQPALRYTRAVVDEALRLYPPGWIVSRRALGPDTVAGVDLPAGTLVLISPWLLHRRAAAWPDPERFVPERFLDTGVDGGDPAAACPAHPTAGPAAWRNGYLPFGAGPRFCIGREFALVEAVLMLATILRDRAVTVPPGAPEPRPEAQVIVHPRDGLPLILGRR